MPLEEEYFKRDLSEAEDAELAAQLEASPELAERFARLAAADAERLGHVQASKPLPWFAWAGAGLLGLCIAVGLEPGPGASSPAPAHESASEPADRPVQHPRRAARRRGPIPHSEAFPSGTAPVADAGQGLVVSPGSSGGFRVRLSSGEPLAGADVRDLQGRLVAGMKPDGTGGAFWDGQAAPGRYQIVVAPSQGKPMARWVEIANQ